MSKKKARKGEAKVKSSKTARRPGGNELSEAQLDQIAGQSIRSQA